MSKLYRIVVAGLLVLVLGGVAVPAMAANVLIITGTNVEQGSAATRLDSLLVARGDTVTTAQNTPVNLAPYSVIYDLRAYAPTRSDSELTQYLGFLNAGPSQILFLLGENSLPAFTDGNTTISTFITQAGGGTVAAPSSFTFDAQTLTPAFNTPNAIGTVSLAASGVVTSTGTGAFGATLAGGTTGSILSFSPGRLANATTGALVVVYDINFLSSAAPSSEGGRFAENLVNYVAVGAPPVAPAAVPTLSEWALILFGLMLAGGAALYLQRRQMAV